MDVPDKFDHVHYRDIHPEWKLLIQEQLVPHINEPDGMENPLSPWNVPLEEYPTFLPPMCGVEPYVSAVRMPPACLLVGLWNVYWKNFTGKNKRHIFFALFLYT